MEYRILIVSENAAERNRYAELLIAEPPAEGITYQIVSVGSVAAAQLQATRQRFDLVVVALSRQDDGLELSGRLKELFPDMRLLLLCEQGVTKSQLKTARLIRASVAESTIEPNSLRAIVSDMLGASALAQQLAQSTKKQEQRGGNNSNRPELPNVVQPFLQPFLEELRRHTRAELAIYSDRAGHIIGQDGEGDNVNVAAVAAVIGRRANDYGELGGLLGDTETVHLCVHEGKQYDVYAANVREDRFLCLFFNKDFVTPKLGFVWLMMKRSAEQLARVN